MVGRQGLVSTGCTEEVVFELSLERVMKGRVGCSTRMRYEPGLLEAGGFRLLLPVVIGVQGTRWVWGEGGWR